MILTKYIYIILLVDQYQGDKEGLRGMTVSKEVLLILASLTASENLREIAIEAKEEEEIEMCEALDIFKQQNIEFGEKRGIKKGTKLGVKKGMVESLIMVLESKMELTDQDIKFIKQCSVEELTIALQNTQRINTINDLRAMLMN